MGVACSGGGGSSSTATPAFDGPVGDNGVFQFIPGPPGTAPGLRVRATVGGSVLESEPVEVVLRAYETYDVVRKNTDPPPSLDVLWPGVARAVETMPVREISVVPEPVPVRFPAGTTIVPRPDTLRPEHRLSHEGRRLDSVRDPARPVTEEGEAAWVAFERALALLSEGDGDATTAKNDCEIPPFSRHREIGTFDGRTIWTVHTFGVERFGLVESYAWALHFAPEGLYISLQYGVGFGLAPNTVGLSITHSIGFGIDDGPNRFRLSGGDLEGMSLSVSFSLGPFVSVGWTMFLQDPPFGLNRQVQFDHGTDIGVTMGFGFLPVFVSWPVSFTLARAVFATRGTAANVPEFVFVRGWGSRCGRTDFRDLADQSGRKGAGSDALAALIDRLEAAAGEDDGSFYGALASSVGASALPLVRSLTVPGAPPAEGIPGSTNGAVLADFLNADGAAVCDSCVDHSIEGGLQRMFRDMRVAGEDAGLVFGAAIDSAATYRRIMPDPTQLSNLSERMVGSIDAAFAIVFEEGAELRDEANRYVDRSVVTIEARAGEPFDLVYTLEELAALVGATRDDVFGATICIAGDFSGPRLEDICVEFTDDFLIGTLRMPDATTMLINATVDLSTAQGFQEIDTSEWLVRPAIRRIINRPNRPVRVTLNAPFEAWSGSPVSLTAVITDEQGNIVDGAADFVFLDGAGNELGSQTTDYGGATLQTILRPVTPTLSAFTSVDLIGIDGERFPGWLVEGTGLGRETDLLVDGVSLREVGVTVGVIRDTQLGIVDLRTEADAPVVLAPGSAQVVAVSPGGEQRSAPLRATVRAAGGEDANGAEASRMSREEYERRMEP
jgi:hypothetical protein